MLVPPLPVCLRVAGRRGRRCHCGFAVSVRHAQGSQGSHARNNHRGVRRDESAAAAAVAGQALLAAWCEAFQSEAGVEAALCRPGAQRGGPAGCMRTRPFFGVFGAVCLSGACSLDNNDGRLCIFMAPARRPPGAEQLEQHAGRLFVWCARVGGGRAVTS